MPRKTTAKKSGARTVRNRNRSNTATHGANLSGMYSAGSGFNVAQDIQAVGRLMGAFIAGHRNVSLTNITGLQLIAWGEDYQQRQQRGGNRTTTERRGTIETEPEQQPQPATGKAARAAA